jgi:hypothetical protein
MKREWLALQPKPGRTALAAPIAPHRLPPATAGMVGRSHHRPFHRHSDSAPVQRKRVGLRNLRHSTPPTIGAVVPQVAAVRRGDRFVACSIRLSVLPRCRVGGRRRSDHDVELPPGRPAREREVPTLPGRLATAAIGWQAGVRASSTTGQRNAPSSAPSRPCDVIHRIRCCKTVYPVNCGEPGRSS